MKLRFIYALVGSLLAFNVMAADDTESNASGTQFTDIFGGTGWHDGAGHVQPGQTAAIQPLNPSFWMNFINPKSHSKMHMAFTNPAQYMQMMQPQFMMQFMNPANYMAMMNPQSYMVMMDPNTWSYWMQPDAYTHGMNMSSYMQMMNPAAYTGFMDPAQYTQWMTPATYSQMIPGAEENDIASTDN